MDKHIFAVEPVAQHKLKPTVLVYVFDIRAQNAGPKCRGVDKLLKPEIISECNICRGKPAVILPRKMEIAHRVYQVGADIGLGRPYKAVYVMVILQVKDEVVILILVGISAEGYIMHYERQIGDCEGNEVQTFGEIVVAGKEELALVVCRIEEERCVQLGLLLD